MRVFSSVLFAALVIKAHCDIYLHNPRGSNNRLDERNRDRANGDRLFDSQNNNRGGSNVGQVYYYEGSTLRLEWTNQHSCGGPNNNCELIFQYMCDDKIRDGTTTKTIPAKPIKCYNWDCDTDVRFGRHESFAYYMNCKNRERNKGLFTADQKLKGDEAIYTRQNPNGARRGYECPEERDYYPYWGPTPWVDIAILTNQPERCASYKAESANVKDRYYCDLPYDYDGVIPITDEECGLAPRMTIGNTTAPWANWVTVPKLGVPPPACQQTTFSRDNHLGNVHGGQTAHYDWVIPNHIHEQCVLRVRYNISTNDMAHFDNTSTLESASLTAEYNGAGRGGHHGRAGASTFPIAEQYLKMKLNSTSNMKEFENSPNEGMIRQYYIKNNPKVDPFGTLLDTDYSQPDTTPKVRFQLAINTAQYGRTFQDRSHKFSIRSRPKSLSGKVIQNLNVRGKRGNIVQTYPGTEYDFVPNELMVKEGDYVHMQWTGSNTNPNNNAGQGKQGTDRHNAVMQERHVYLEEGMMDSYAPLPVHGHPGMSYAACLSFDCPGCDPVTETCKNQRREAAALGNLGLSTGKVSRIFGLPEETARGLAIHDTEGGQLGGEQSELDDSGTYFDIGPQQLLQKAVFNFFCTRNNNFSNRSQKGKVKVSAEGLASQQLDSQPQSLVSEGSWITVKKDDLTRAVNVKIVTHPENTKSAFDKSAASSIVEMLTDDPDNKLPVNKTSGTYVTVGIEYEESPLSYATLYRAENMEANFVEVESAEFDNGVATAKVEKGGVFVVNTTPAYVAIVLVSAVVLGFLSVVAWFVFKKFRSSDLGNANAHNGV